MTPGGESAAATVGPGASLPAEALALLASGAKVLDVQALPTKGSQTLAVLASLPNPPGLPASAPPMQAQVAIVNKVPAGWRIAVSIVKGFALNPKIQVVQIAGAPGVSLFYYTGANSQGLLVLRNETVVYDGVADSVLLQDVKHDGALEVVKSWSPFCQSHVASPRLSTVYAWRNGEFEVATSQFPEVISKDSASFQAAITRANLSTTTPVWTGGQKACLHDSLAYLAQEAGNSAEAQAQLAQVAQLDPSYDPTAIQKAAAGQQVKTSP